MRVYVRACVFGISVYSYMSARACVCVCVLVCVCACVCVCMCMCCVLCSHGDFLATVFLAAVAFFAGFFAVAFFAGFFAICLAVCEMRGNERWITVGRKGKTKMDVRKRRLEGNYKRCVDDLRCLWCTKITHSLSPFLHPCLLSFIPLSFPSSLSRSLPPPCTHLVSIYDTFGSFLCLPQLSAVIRNLENFMIDIVLEICMYPRGTRDARTHTHTNTHI